MKTGLCEKMKIYQPMSLNFLTELSEELDQSCWDVNNYLIILNLNALILK